MTIRFLQSLVMGLAMIAMAGGAYAAKGTICHKDLETITINVSAWPAHKAHGDVWDSCDKYAKYSVTAIFRCGLSAEGDLVVTSVSSSEDFPVEEPLLVVEGDNCAVANATLINSKFNLKNVTAGSVGSNFETEYFYSRKYLRYHHPDRW